ncbi:MAG: DUF4214 domain-containing protein [Candidatus Tectomicrobia bacterium]|nr:DUF4214 domain-containing protein [Candidatus Tectomicrobia bacterium]
MDEAQIIQNAYLAYYGRPADPAGLDYWAGRLKDADGNLGEIIAAFGTSAEFTDRFGQLENTELVNAIYQRLLKRDADPSGLEFYLDQLESGEKDLGSIALDIFNGVKQTDNRRFPPLDWEIIEEIQRTANAFTEQVRLGDLDYSGERGLEVGTQLVASIPITHVYANLHRRSSLGLDDIFHDEYYQPDWYASMFTAQLGEDRSVITVDRLADVAGFDSEITVPVLWLAGQDSITFEGRFHNLEPATTEDTDRYALYNLPPGDYLIELTGADLPDDASLNFILASNPYSDYVARDSSLLLRREEPVLEYRLRTEDPLAMDIRLVGSNTDADYELTVTLQHNANYPAWEMEWQYRPESVASRDDRVLLDFVFVEDPPEFYDYMI